MLTTKSPSSILRRSARLSLPAMALIETDEEKSVLQQSSQHSRKRKGQTSHDVLSSEGVLQDQKTTKIKRTSKSAQVAEDDDDFLDPSPRPHKSAKPRKTRERQPSPVYMIPDVVTKETTFKGRLGDSSSYICAKFATLTFA